MAKNWYIKLRDNKPLRGGLVTWEIFKKAFIDRFFPREKSELKVVEFINLRQGGMILLAYYLNLLICECILLLFLILVMK